MSGALDVLKMKEEDALKVLVSRNPLRGAPTLTSRWNSTSTKGRVMASTSEI